MRILRTLALNIENNYITIILYVRSINLMQLLYTFNTSVLHSFHDKRRSPVRTSVTADIDVFFSVNDFFLNVSDTFELQEK